MWCGPCAFGETSVDYTELTVALGLMLVIEGLLYALFPDVMRRAMAQMLAMPVGQIRMAALFSVALGVGLVWLVKA